MNKKFLSVMLLATFFLGSTSLFIACSDDDTVYDDTSVTSQISSLTSQLATLQSALTEAQNAASAAQSTADDALANAASAASAAASADDDAAAANNAALAANQAAEAASALAESAAATAKAEAIAEAIEQTKELIAASEEATDEQIQALALLIEGIDSDLNELSGALDGVSEEVKANAAAIVALQEQMTAVEKYKEDIESLSKTIESIESDLTAVSNRVEGIELDLDALTLTVNGIENDLKGLSSDVTNLTETVTDIQASLLALTGNVNDLSSTLNGLLGDFSNLSDYVDNLSSTLTSLSGTVSDLSSTVDGKCTMDEVKDYIAQVLSGDTQVVYTKDEVDELLADIAKQISTINEALLILQTYKITSLVFIPELYVNGIEATRFAYASGVAWGEKVFAETTGTTYENYTYVIPKGSIGDFYKVTKKEDSVWYNLAPNTTKVSYHYNPSSADLSGVTFDFDVRNVEAITRASDPTWSADWVSSTWSKGNLDVYYKISSTGNSVADGLCDPKDDQDGEVSVMSLKATLANDTTVNSDYAAIVPAKRRIDYIAFTTASKCTADKTGATGSCDDAYDLYQYAQDAAKCTPSIECPYNYGALDLAELLCVHYTQADYGEFGSNYCEGIMNLADLESWGLSLEFASIAFQVGANKTDQSAYCIVTEDGKFTPAYISGTGTTTAIEENSTSGKSSIGRTPLVVVKLVDGNGSVVAFGYVRIKITEAATTTPEDDYITVGETTTAFDCDAYSESVSWEKISADLYEYKKVSAEYFRSHYTTDDYTYIKNAKGKFVQSDDYGTISQSGDISGDNTTTVLKVTVTAEQKFNIVEDTDDRTQTIYIKYSYGSDVVYVGFSITVAELPTVKFAERIGRLWVDETDGELNDGDETKWNVPAPGTPGKTVLNYTLTLDDLFFDQKVVATLGGEYKDKYKASEVNYTYSFATTQDKIDSYSLYVNAAGDSLFADKSMDANYLVASITNSETGAIKYATTGVAKEILNLYAHDNNILAYAKVKLDATYGTCKRELEGRTFIVDFLRPIDIVAGEDAIFEDATAMGDTVSLASLISIKDWRDKTVYSKKYPNGYSDNGVNLYEYYDFKTIEVDLEKAKYNGSDDRLASSANVQLSLVDKNGNSLSNTQSIDSAGDLSDIYIKQYNTLSVTSDYTLQIPIKLTYAWGTVEDTINATVKRTMAN